MSQEVAARLQAPFALVLFDRDTNGGVRITRHLEQQFKAGQHLAGEGAR